MNADWLELFAIRAGWSLLHTFWQGAIVGLIVAIVLPWVRSAAARHGLGMLALVAMALLLFANMAGRPAAAPDEFVSQPDRAIGSVGIDHTAAAEPPPQQLPPERADSAIEVPAVAPVERVEDNGRRKPIAAQLRPFIPWIAGVWLIGVVLLSIRQIGGWGRVRRWKREGVTPASAAIDALARRAGARLKLWREVPVLISERVAAPLLAGVIKPVVLLPAAIVSGLKPHEIEAILAHELAHFRRRDGWANLIQIGIETLLFYHPAVWWLGRLTRREREHAADDLAVRSCTRRNTYLMALAAVAEFQFAENGSGPAVAASGGSVAERIRRLLAPSPDSDRVSPAIAGALALIVALAAVGIGQMTSGVADAQEKAAKADGPRIRVAPGESIQAAIDSADDGSIILLAKGVYAQRIRIEKPLTIEGAGWEKTLLRPKSQPEEGEIPPTIEVVGATDVTLRGLKVSVLKNPKPVEQIGWDSVISISASGVTIEDCVVVGPTGMGVVISNRSEVKMSGSLVAAVWGTGVSVQGGETAAGASRLEMRDCVVRNCYHRCIALGPYCDTSVIEGNWISGSAWHGIRYDNASPRIERNFIFRNARSGIYASGKTTATVRRNAFVENEMNGMSCWYENADTIEANLFWEDKRESLGVFGASTPKVTTNWFHAGGNAAVLANRIGGTGATAQTPGKPDLSGNRFTGPGKPFLVEGDPAPLPRGNERLNEGFGGVTFHNFGPIDDPWKAVVYVKPGALLALCKPPAWPGPLPEEVRIIPTEVSRNSREWKKDGPGQLAEADLDRRRKEIAEIGKSVQPWVDDAFQLDDIGKRESAIERVRTALRSDDSVELRRGLMAFVQFWEVRFDKASFHDLFLPVLESEDASLRLLAARCLVMAGDVDGDLDRLIALKDDPDRDVREGAAHLIVTASDYDLTGKSGKAILALLGDEDPAFRKEILRAMWGAKFSPQLEARVIELTEADGYDALYFALSPQANKSEKSVKRLIEFLADRDTVNVANRAAWGLAQGVAESEQGIVAEAALKVVAARDQGSLLREALRRLAQYGGPEQVPGIEELLAKPGADGEFREKLEAVLAEIEAR